MAEKHHNPSQKRASLVRAVEAAEDAADPDAVKRADAALAAHDEAQAMEGRFAASRARQEEAAEQRRRDQRRRKQITAVLDQLQELEETAPAVRDVFDTAAARLLEFREKRAAFSRELSDLGMIDHDLASGAAQIGFEGELGDRLVTQGILLRGQRYGQLPEAEFRPAFVATVRRDLKRLLEG